MLSAILSFFRISDVFSLLVVLIVIYVTQYYYHFFTRTNPLPGPFPLPVIGNAHQQSGLGFNDWLALLHKKYGDMFELNLAGDRMIVLCRTDLVENMYIASIKTKYPFKFHIPEGFLELGIDGTGISSNNDMKSWKFNRKFFLQAMIAPRFHHQVVEWTNDLWEEMDSYWNNIGANKELELDLATWMRRFTNEIVFKIATGVNNSAVFSYYSTFVPESSLNEKEKKKIEESEKFIDSLITFINGLPFFIIVNNFVRRYVPFIRSKSHKLLKNKDYLFSRLYKVIEERKIEIENTPLDQPLRNDMLTSFLTANTARDINPMKHNDNEAEFLRPMTDREIFGNVFDALRAGTTTPASLLCFIVYYLGQYPEVKQKLIQELDTVLGTKPITPQDLEKLPYCEAVIKEVHRYCPVVYVDGRVNVAKDEVGGLNWPEGTSFKVYYAAILKRKEYWTNPEKFDPDRFYKIEESDKYLLEKQHVKNSFAMFGGGIRICPGRKVAMTEIKFILTSIYRKYDVELSDVNAPLAYKPNLTAACEKLLIKIKPRSPGTTI